MRFSFPVRKLQRGWGSPGSLQPRFVMLGFPLFLENSPPLSKVPPVSILTGLSPRCAIFAGSAKNE